MGRLSLGASFACPTSFSISGKGGLGGITSWFWYLYQEPQAVLYLCLSTLGTAVKHPNLSLTVCSVSGSCVFCLPGWWVGGAVGPGLINPLGWETSLSAWSQSEHRPTSWAPLWPSFYNTKHPPCSYGLYMYLPLPTCKEFTGWEALGKTRSLPQLQGLGKEWPPVWMWVLFKAWDLLISQMVNRVRGKFW